jgi:hypothetical protein
MTLEEAERAYQVAQALTDLAHRHERECAERVEAMRAADARERARERRAARRLGIVIVGETEAA